MLHRALAEAEPYLIAEYSHEIQRKFAAG